MLSKNLARHDLEQRKIAGSQALAVDDPYTTQPTVQRLVNEFEQDPFCCYNVHVMQVYGVSNAVLASP